MAKHEALAPSLPSLETGFIILGEFLERLAHLLVGQKLPQASTAFDLFLKISMFILHDGVTVYALTRQLPRSIPPTILFGLGFPPVRRRNGGSGA